MCTGYSFKDFDIYFPLSKFESQMLTMMNVEPSQLHPNSWAILRYFQILCDLMYTKPTINKLMYFYQLKHRVEIGWVSLSATQYDQLFILHSSSFRHFKDNLFKIKPKKKDPLKCVLFCENFESRFPLY